MKQKILIVDDHPVFREGLQQIISRDPAFEVVGSASDGHEALKLIDELKPSIAIIDIELPKMDGLTVLRRLFQMRHPVHVILLTMYKKDSFVREAINLNARGYVLKDNAITDILAALRAVADGDYYMSPSVSNLLMKQAGPGAKVDTVDRLTPNQQRVLSLISDNKTTREIATALSVSPHTVETHRKKICEKLGLKGHQSLLRFALQNKTG